MLNYMIYFPPSKYLQFCFIIKTMLFPRIASRALVLWLLVLSWLTLPLLSHSMVLAAAPTEGEYDPWGNTTGLQESYESVIREGCTTPSLECLVYHVYQFISVEMSKNVITFQVDFTPVESRSSTSLPSSRSVAMGGAVGGLATMMNGMYQRPIASSTTYIADVLESANVVTPAYAQGLGFAALDPILDLWKTFRNIAYIFFVIIFVVIGFMIMFRQKLGQTAITAQQAIPKIIIALILVTFSYAIAGFAIDLMYLTMTLIIGVFYNVLPAGNEILGYDILKLISTLVGAVWDGDANRTLISNIVGGTVNSSGLGTELIGAIGGTLLTVILAIAVLIGTVRLFFELLRCYATVVLSVVVSPLLLMMEAIPGKSAFKGWVKTLVGHLSAFPVVLMVLVMFYAFTDNAVRPTGGFMPPFMLGSGQAGNITSVMGLAIILAMPDIVQSIRKTIAPENTFATMITTGALKQARQAAPLPVKAGSAAMMAPIGLGVGATRSILDNRDTLRDKSLSRKDKWAILKNDMKQGSARYAGNYASQGAKLGGRISSALGASTPALLSPFDKGLDYIANVASEEETLKRLSSPHFKERGPIQRIMNPGAMKKDEWEKRLQMANADRQRQEEYQEAMKKGDWEKAKNLMQAKSG